MAVKAKHIIMRIFAILFFMASVLSICCVAKANDEAIVYGDDAEINVGEEATIPVKIDNNNGIMGFKITLEYDPDIIEVINVVSGSLTSSGIFDSNAGMKKGIVDVIWSNTKDISESGELCKIRVKAIKEFDESEIKITYSKEDTFNEKWEDVSLKCNNINVTYVGDNNSKQEATNSDSVGSNNISEKDSAEKDNNQSDDSPVVTDSQFINAIDETLYELGYENIDSVEDTGRFIQTVNKKIEEKTGEIDYYSDKSSDDIEIIKSDYKEKTKNELEKKIKENIEPSKIEDAIDAALKEVGKTSINDISEEDEKNQFIVAFQNELSEVYPDVNNLKDIFDNDEITEIAREIYEKDEAGNNDNIQSEESNQRIFLISIVLIVIIIAGVSCGIIIKKRNGRKEIFDEKKD